MQTKQDDDDDEYRRFQGSPLPHTMAQHSKALSNRVRVSIVGTFDD